MDDLLQLALTPAEAKLLDTVTTLGMAATTRSPTIPICYMFARLELERTPGSVVTSLTQKMLQVGAWADQH